MYCWCGWLSSFRDKNFNRGFPDQKLNLLVSFYSWAGSHRWDMLRSKKMTGRRPTSLGHSDHSNNHYKASLKRGTWTTLPRKKSILDITRFEFNFVSSIEFQMKKHANVLKTQEDHWYGCYATVTILCGAENHWAAGCPRGRREVTSRETPVEDPWSLRFQMGAPPVSKKLTQFLMNVVCSAGTTHEKWVRLWHTMTINDHWSQDLSPKQYRNPCAK